MTKQELNRLEKIAKTTRLWPSEKLCDALRAVQESFDALVKDGEFSRVDEKIIRKHFKGTVCV